MSDIQTGTVAPPDAAVHVLDYALADRIDADTPARLKALGDPLRHLILDLVLERAMSVTELAERVRRPRGTVAHHVDLLVDAGLLQVVRTRKVRAMEERFYGRTARTIYFPDDIHGTDLPFFADARALFDDDAPKDTPGLFTMRSARIPESRAQEFVARLEALALEFIDSPRGGEREFAVLLGLFATNRPVAPKPTPPSKPKPTTKPKPSSSSSSSKGGRRGS